MTEMKKILLLTLILAMLMTALATAEQSPVTFADLIADLVEAYKNPSDSALLKIDADVEALQDEVAASIAEHWKAVYLDPDYRLLIHGQDDPALLQIPNNGQDHAIVILGYELLDGEMTDELKGRCEAGAAVAKAYPASVLVCTGGATGENNPDQHTEAGLMKDYLVQTCGLDADRILTDDRALTTTENALNTFVIMQEQGIHTMTIVTSSYHQRRGQTLYNAVSAQYKKAHDYPIGIIGNYNLDIEPSLDIYRMDEVMAAFQLGTILELPEEENAALSASLSKYMPARPSRNPHDRILGLVSGRFAVTELKIGEAAAMEGDEKTCLIRAFDIEGKGRLCLLELQSAAGTTYVGVFAPTEADAPLFIYDCTLSGEDQTLLLELYDTAPSAVASDALLACREKYAALPAYEKEPSWSDALLLPASDSKKGSGIRRDMDGYLLDYSEAYLDLLQQSEACGRAAKTEANRAVAHGFLEKGGIAVDGLRDMLSEAELEKLVCGYMFCCE